MTESINPRKPQIYPLDVDTLQKGEWISPERCAAIHGVSPEEDPLQFGFETMKLAKRIEVLSAQTDRRLYCHGEKQGIHVMTDEEHTEYARRKRRMGVRKITGAEEILSGTDLREVSEEGRHRWEREMIISSRMSDTVRRVERGQVPQFAPRKKTTPNVLDGSVKRTTKDPARLLPGYQEESVVEEG